MFHAVVESWRDNDDLSQYNCIQTKIDNELPVNW